MSVIEYKCPCCNANLVFNSNEQKLICNCCDNTFDADAIKAFNEDLSNSEEDTYDWEEYNSDTGSGDWSEKEKNNMKAFCCPSCGGEIVGDANTISTHCPYCDSPTIMTKQISGTYKPDYIIPFKLDKNIAKKSFKEFIKRKPLLPKIFKSRNKIEEIKGIYVPFWLFDCETNSRIKYKTTKVRTWSDSNYRYTKTSHYHVLRAGNADFNKIPVDGSIKMDDEYMEAIEPFDYNQTVDFDSAYLSGYLADKYDVDDKESISRANSRVKSSVEDILRDTVIGYTSCTALHSNININKGKVRYALLPVWMLNTKYKDKIYTFVMNGQTGKFVGKLPIDWCKFWLWFFGLFVGTGIITTFIMSI